MWSYGCGFWKCAVSADGWVVTFPFTVVTLSKMAVGAENFTESNKVRWVEFEFRVEMKGLNVVDFKVLHLAAVPAPTFDEEVLTADGWPVR